MTKASQKKGQSEWENETRASAKMSQSKWKNETKQVDQDQPKDERSRRPPKSRDKGCRKTRRSTMISKSLPRSTEVYWTTTANNNRFESKSSTEQWPSTVRWPCQKMHPTDKPKAHRGSLPRQTENSTEKSTEKLTREVLPTSSKPTGKQPTETRTEKSTKKSTKIQLKMTIKSNHEGWSPKRTLKDESMPSTDDSSLQDIFYRACGSTAWRLKRAQTHLHLVSITIQEKLTCYILTNKARLTYMIDGYDRCRQRSLPSMPSHERKLYPHDSHKDLRRDMSYGNDVRWSMG